jgi:small multidrug resistance family-3 protein
MNTFLLYLVTALAEILGCYLPWLWLRQGKSAWLLIPAAVSLATFAWLLTLHEAASGRVYAAYGGVYVGVALLWLWRVDDIRPSVWDVLGVAVTLVGMSIIAFQPK